MKGTTFWFPYNHSILVKHAKASKIPTALNRGPSHLNVAHMPYRALEPSISFGHISEFPAEFNRQVVGISSKIQPCHHGLFVFQIPYFKSCISKRWNILVSFIRRIKGVDRSRQCISFAFSTLNSITSPLGPVLPSTVKHGKNLEISPAPGGECAHLNATELQCSHAQFLIFYT